MPAPKSRLSLLKLSMNCSMNCFCLPRVAVVLSALVVAAAVTAPTSAHAQTTITWTGTGANANWATVGSWSTTPTDSGTWSLVFSGTSGTVNTFNNIGTDGSTVTVGSILYNSTASPAGYHIYTSGSRTITFTNGATIQSAAITSGTVAPNLGGNLVGSGTVSFDLGNAHNLNFAPTALTGSFYIAKTGSGQLSLTGTTGPYNAYTGMEINGGLVNFNSVQAREGFDSKVVALNNGGNIRFNVGNTGTSSMQVALNGNGRVDVNGSTADMVFSAGQFNVATAATSAATLLLTPSSGAGRGEIQGAIVNNTSHSVSVSLTGSTTWILGGANTYTGTTGIAAVSRMLLDGSISTGTVSVNGTLGGSGSAAGRVNVLAGGTIAPGGTLPFAGSFSDSVATLSVGSLEMNATARAQLSITGTGAGSYDQIVGTAGGVTYGGTLALTMNGSYDAAALLAANQTWNLFSGFSSWNQGLSAVTLSAGGDFAGLTFSEIGNTGIWQTGYTVAPTGARLRFNENNGTLIVAPEPGAMLMTGVGMLICGWKAWARRRRQGLQA